MHELSIAQSIVEIVEQHVTPEDLQLVREVKVTIGEMAGVVPDSLEFCFSAIIVDTALQNSRIAIEYVPYTLHCSECHEDFRSAYGIVQCPKCEGFETIVVSGTELNVAEIEVAEPLEIV
jgi:hydrogenase nickel incorporation protein HypA/HybF